MRSDDTDYRGVRWRRWNFSKSVAGTCTDSRTHTYTNPDADANANPDADTNTDANTHTNAHAWRRDHNHHHVRGRITKDADGGAGDTRDIRQQRHAGTRDGLQSAS
jgi:hypothetical protein